MKKVTLLFGLTLNIMSFSVMAVTQYNITPTLVGVQPGTVFIGLDTNPNNCLYGGVYFTDASNMRKEALATVISAKALNKVVRMDFNGGAGTICSGTGIFIQ